MPLLVHDGCGEIDEMGPFLNDDDWVGDGWGGGDNCANYGARVVISSNRWR